LLKARCSIFISSENSVQKSLFKKPGEKFKKGIFSKKELFDLFHLAWRYQIFKPNCLPTSMAKQAFLAHYGFPTQIRIGVQKEGEKLKAHAWLEDGPGDILGEPQDAYHPLHFLKKGPDGKHA
jgi:hypothetical protein